MNSIEDIKRRLKYGYTYPNEGKWREDLEELLSLVGELQEQIVDLNSCMKCKHLARMTSVEPWACKPCWTHPRFPAVRPLFERKG